MTKHIALVATLLVVLTGCPKRTVVNEAGATLSGPRIDMALALSEMAADQVELAGAVNALQDGGALSQERADRIRELNADVARFGQVVNRALADRSDDQTVLDAVATLQTAAESMVQLLPEGQVTRTIGAAVIGALQTILNAAEQLPGDVSYERGTILPDRQSLAA